jgi:hypothetical protein
MEATMFVAAAKFIAKFVAVGIAAATVSWLCGADPHTAAHITFWTQVVWLIAREIPSGVWLAIGEAFAEMVPWILIANIDL